MRRISAVRLSAAMFIVIAATCIRPALAVPTTYFFSGQPIGCGNSVTIFPTPPGACDGPITGYLSMPDDFFAAPFDANNRKSISFTGGPFGMVLSLAGHTSVATGAYLDMAFDQFLNPAGIQDWFFLNAGNYDHLDIYGQPATHFTFWWVGKDAMDASTTVPDASRFVQRCWRDSNDQCYLGLDGQVGEAAAGGFTWPELSMDDILPFTFTKAQHFIPVQVPEPASLALLGLGLVGVGMTRRRRST